MLWETNHTMLADCSMECDAMAKPTKKKISPSATANNERKPRRSKIGADVDFDLPFEAKPAPFFGAYGVSRAVGATGQPGRAQPPMDDHRKPEAS
jgi:hypothetical protein